MIENLEVVSIDSRNVREWFLYKHYAKRLPNSMYTFALYKEQKIIGVCNYGIPANSSFGNEFIELNRLVIDDDVEKNTLSFFLSKTLNMLPRPMKIVSYADTGKGHNGYIYQATNWIYTGLGSADTSWKKNGRIYHRKSLADKYGTGKQEDLLNLGYEMIREKPKHRYFYILGNSKKEKKYLTKELLKRFNQLPYPKGENKRYDASFKPNTQTKLF